MGKLWSNFRGHSLISIGATAVTNINPIFYLSVL